MITIFVHSPTTVFSAPEVPSDLKGENVPFLPYLEYTLDEKGNLDIETLALEKSLEFFPLHPFEIDPKTGVYWLRFTLASQTEGTRQVEWLLALGESLPGDPKLYVPDLAPASGAPQWREIPITDRHIISLPEHDTEAKTCYIRLAGPPGLWFNPTLRSPHNAANNWGALAHPAAVIALGLLLLLCLVRCFAESGQWRIWTALFVASSLASAYMGLPTVETGHVGFDQYACVLAPGVALMLLPHIARYILSTGKLSRIIDAQLILLTLVGACVTLLPLAPGCAWLAHFLELWPLGTVFFIPTALWALFLGLPRSQRFLLVCLIPPIFTASGILGLLSGFPPDFFGTMPLWGITMSALLLVSAPNPKPAREQKKAEEETITLKDLEDPNLKIVSLEPDAPMPPRETTNLQEEKKEKSIVSQDNRIQIPSSLANDLEEPLYTLFTESQKLENCALPPAVRSHANTMVDCAKRLLSIVHGECLETGSQDKENALIDLQIMMRDIYNNALQASKNSELALGWYMPPDLPSIYAGNTKALRTALQMLVESSVRATDQGSVHFTVQKYPESDDPGHLLFAVTDTGKGMPPRDRSGIALSRAWEVAASSGGSISLESSTEGTTVYLSVHLVSQAEMKQKKFIVEKPHILISTEKSAMHEQLHSIIEPMHLRTTDVDSLQEALSVQREDPASLVITHGGSATPLAKPLIEELRKVALNAGAPFCKILAITTTDLEWTELGKAGYTLALLEPLDVEALRTTVAEFKEDFEAGLDRSRKSQRSQEIDLPLPDLFGSGNRRVPKHMDELKGLASIIHSFSSLPSKEHLENPDLALFEDKESESPQNSVPSAQTDKLNIIPPLSDKSLDSLSLTPDNEKQDLPKPFSDNLPKNEAVCPPTLVDVTNEMEEKTLSPADFSDDKARCESTRGQSNPPSSHKEPSTTLEQKKNECPEETPSNDIHKQTIPPISESTDSSTEQHAPLLDQKELSKESIPSAISQTSPAKDQVRWTFSQPPELPRERPAQPILDAESSSLDGISLPLPHPEATRQLERKRIITTEEAVTNPATDHELPDTVAGQPSDRSPLSEYVSDDARRTMFMDDEWVGEPFPVKSPKKEAAACDEIKLEDTHSHPTVKNSLNENDHERELDHCPAEKTHDSLEQEAPSWLSLDSSKKPSPALSNPLPKESENVPEKSATEWTSADEWVGEPFPVSKPSFTTSEESASSASSMPESSSTHDKSVGNPIHVTGQNLEDIPKKKASSWTYEGDSQNRRQDSDNVLDFIEGIKDVDAVQMSPLPASLSTLPNDLTPSAPVEEQGRGPDPALLAFVERLEIAVNDAQKALQLGQTMRVAEAANRIAAECDAFSFRVLARIARCVEQAGKAGDIHALADLLPELVHQIERSNIALKQIR
ncbi:MAG: hypothetical protein K5657_03045 [Desulfovibrio sp.]|nr:hypothetical protein [Desulfovibrio sp.]